MAMHMVFSASAVKDVPDKTSRHIIQFWQNSRVYSSSNKRQKCLDGKYVAWVVDEVHGLVQAPLQVPKGLLKHPTSGLSIVLLDDDSLDDSGR